MKAVMLLLLTWMLVAQVHGAVASSEFDSPDQTNTRVAGKPSVPGNFRVIRYSSTVIELFWDAATDDRLVVGYQVSRDDTDVYMGNGRSYFEPHLEPGRRYRYSVVAIDSDGNFSNPATATFVADADGRNNGSATGNPDANSGDTTPPSTPGNFRGVFYSATAAELFWDSSSDDRGIAAYEIVRDGVPLSTLGGHSYYESALHPGQLYRYGLVAVDAAGNRSGTATLVLQGDGGGVNNSGAGFELTLDQSRVSLQEGNNHAVDVGVQLRRDRSSSPVQLSVRFERREHGQDLNVWFQNNVLGAGNTSTRLGAELPIGMAPVPFHERTLIVSATDGQTTREQRLVLDIQPIQVPDVYLLIGQSNMEGYSQRGAKASWEGGADQPDERIRQLNVQPNSLGVFYDDWLFTDESNNVASPRYIRAEDPLHEPRGQDRSYKEGNFIGMGLSFAKAALSDTSQEIYLVPAAWGASGFCANQLGSVGWNGYASGDPGFGGTRLADRALTRLNMTLRDTGGIFRGILWHQGEADSNDWACANRYAENLNRLVQRIRSEAMVDRRGGNVRGPSAKIPFVLGTMSKGGEFQWFGEIKSVVDAAHRNVTASVPYADFVNADDLVPGAYPCGDGSCIHFGAEALREMGFRYYSALRRVHSRE